MKILHIAMLIISLCILGCGRDENTSSTSIGLIGKLTKYCVDGYEFMDYYIQNSRGVIQVWENTANGPRPKMCTPQGAE